MNQRARYTNSNPANCMSSNCICTRMNHPTSEQTRHSIFFAIFTVFIGHTNTTKIGNNFKFYCYVSIHFSFVIEYSQRLHENLFFVSLSFYVRSSNTNFIRFPTELCLVGFLIRSIVVVLVVVMNFLFCDRISNFKHIK